MDENFTEKQVMLFIKNKVEVKLSEIMVEFNKSTYLTRSILSKPLILKQLKEERIKGDSIITFVGAEKHIQNKKERNDSITINPLDKKESVVDTSKMLGIPNESKYFQVTGIGTLSPKLISQLFSENILVIDVEKLIKKMNASTLKIHNDKISFDLVAD